jgi:hypothetical protein
VHRELSGRGGRYIALVGTEDLIVVETDDAILICRKGAGETMRTIVARLRDQGRHELI